MLIKGKVKRRMLGILIAGIVVFVVVVAGAAAGFHFWGGGYSCNWPFFC